MLTVIESQVMDIMMPSKLLSEYLVLEINQKQVYRQ